MSPCRCPSLYQQRVSSTTSCSCSCSAQRIQIGRYSCSPSVAMRAHANAWLCSLSSDQVGGPFTSLMTTSARDYRLFHAPALSGKLKLNIHAARRWFQSLRLIKIVRCWRNILAFLDEGLETLMVKCKPGLISWNPLVGSPSFLKI